MAFAGAKGKMAQAYLINILSNTPMQIPLDIFLSLLLLAIVQTLRCQTKMSLVADGKIGKAILSSVSHPQTFLPAEFPNVQSFPPLSGILQRRIVNCSSNRPLS